MKFLLTSMLLLAVIQLTGCAGSPKMSTIWYDKSYQILQSPGSKNIVISTRKKSKLAISPFNSSEYSPINNHGVPFRLMIKNLSSTPIYVGLLDISPSQKNGSPVIASASDLNADNEKKAKTMAILTVLGGLGIVSNGSNPTTANALETYTAETNKLLESNDKRYAEENSLFTETIFSGATIMPGKSSGGIVVVKKVNFNELLNISIKVGNEVHEFSLSKADK